MLGVLRYQDPPLTGVEIQHVKVEPAAFIAGIAEIPAVRREGGLKDGGLAARLAGQDFLGTQAGQSLTLAEVPQIKSR